MNLLLTCDSYKHAFHKFYPSREITGGYAYIMPRVPDKNIVPFGLSMAIKKYLSKPITLDDINEAEDLLFLHGLPFNRKLWLRVLYNHGGYLPLRIRGIPEGTVIKSRVPIVTIESTDSDYQMYTLVTFIETVLQRAIYYPTTIASLGYETKHKLRNVYEQTSDYPELVDYALHDFGARGVSSEESAEIGGIAHLVNFRGTDNLSAVVAGRNYYACDMAGVSIAATEHSVQCAYGVVNQAGYISRVLNAVDIKNVSIVLDGYDIYREVSLFCDMLLQFKHPKGKSIVLRLDSGDPSEVISKVLTILEARLDCTLNSKCFKVLNHNVKIMQADGIDYESILTYLKVVTDNGFAAENIVFGSGGGLLQRVDRDMFGFAQKTSALKIEGDWVDVIKNPITDKTKSSIGGKVSCDNMTVFYENGKIFNHGNLTDIRQRVSESQL